MKNLFGVFSLGLFVLYFQEILILNEKFLILVIFLSFIFAIKKYLGTEIELFFSNRSKELLKEIFLFEYSIDSKYSFIYLYLTLDLMRKKLFFNIYKLYNESLNFLAIFYYNFLYRQKNHLLISNFNSLVNDVYYFILKKHVFIKLNFLYRSYFYIFNKFKSI